MPVSALRSAKAGILSFIRETVLFFRRLGTRLSRDPYRIKEDYITANPDVGWWENHLNHRVIREKSPEITGHIADFGCNHGACTILMARQGMRVLGVDINPEALKLASRLKMEENPEVRSRLEFACTRFSELPFADNSLDGGFMIDVLEHIYEEDRPLIFKEIKRVLKKGARLLIVTPFEHAYDDGYQHVAFFNEDSLKTIMSDLGVSVLDLVRDRRPDAHTPGGHDRINVLVEIP